MRVLLGIIIGAVLVIGYVTWQLIKSGPLIK